MSCGVLAGSATQPTRLTSGRKHACQLCTVCLVGWVRNGVVAGHVCRFKQANGLKGFRPTSSGASSRTLLQSVAEHDVRRQRAAGQDVRLLSATATAYKVGGPACLPSCDIAAQFCSSPGLLRCARCSPGQSCAVWPAGQVSGRDGGCSGGATEPGGAHAGLGHTQQCRPPTPGSACRCRPRRWSPPSPSPSPAASPSASSDGPEGAAWRPGRAAAAATAATSVQAGWRPPCWAQAYWPVHGQ